MAMVVVVALAISPAAANAQYGGDGCDYCGDSSSYYVPGYDAAVFTPSYDSAMYTPSYDSAMYTPSYDSAVYTPSYDSPYTPSYDNTYAPSYDNNTYTPSYSSPNSYIPSYSSPSYSSPFYSSPVSSPFYSAPSPFVRAPQSQPQSQSQSQAQSQSSYNSNPNTNINPNSNTNSNTNSTGPSTSVSSSNPYTTSQSSTGAVTSTNTNTNNPVANASNGPITISNTVNVVPAQPQRLAQYTIPAPYCTITASNAYSYGGYSNQPITLTWVSTNATSAYITPNVGTVNPSGSTVVYPQGYTTYTLTISGPGGSATCQSTANYASNYIAPVQSPYVTPAPVYYSQPATPAVSLTQIPYTGFDYGPVGNAIYWMSLFAFAAAAGYLMVYYRGGAFAFVASLVGRGSNGSHDFSLDGQAEETISETADEPVIVHETVIAPEVEETPAVAHVLPTMESHRMTTDSMIINTSMTGAPRIVIARA